MKEKDNNLFSIKEMYAKYRRDTKDPIPYNQYKKVIYLWNKLIVEKIMEGYKFKAPYSLGIFEILRCDRNHGRKIKDWGESNKLKQRILDRGGIPLEVFKDEEGNIIGNNGGENWLVYHVDDNYLKFNWYKTNASRYIKNLLRYKFQCTDGNKKSIRKLKDKPLKELYYGYNTNIV